VSPAAAETFRSVPHGYVLELPAGWVQVPLDVVNRRSQELGAAEDKEMEAVFQPAEGGGDLSYPCVHLKVKRYADPPVSRQPSDEELPAIIAGLRQLDVSTEIPKVVSPQIREKLRAIRLLEVTLDPQRRRYSMVLELDRDDVGTVRGFVDGYFGREALVKVLYWVRTDQADQAAGTLASLRDSFRFDDDKAFLPGQTSEADAGDWQHTAMRLGIAAAALLAILGIGSLRKRKTAPSP
jgi:hypothetical protein